jgi:hypothetical protein
MKKYLFLIAGFFVAGTVFAQKKTVINDPNAEVRNVKNFHAIHVSHAINLYLTQSDEEAVAVSARETKYRERIRTEVKDGVLRIWYDNEGWNWSNDNKKLKAYVSVKTLDRLNASGASDILVDGVITGDKLNIDLSGASDFKGSVKMNELNLDQSGASDITISGSAGRVTIEASGASDVKGYDLITDNCDAHASGASDIKISVNKELNAHASGASSIYYKGTAVIRDLHSNGASSVGKN